MSSLNKPNTAPRTHEGGAAVTLTIEQQLTRSVLACLLWEREFYEDGVSIAERIESLVQRADPQFVADLALRARSEFHLRHVPLLLTCALARRHALRADTLAAVIQRADELSEFLAVYWRNGRTPIAAQAKKGLARAFRKFDEYQLARYQSEGAVKLRDVLFMVHPAPLDADQQALWTRLATGTLATPDTWEVAISALPKDAKAARRTEWERLLVEGRLGYLALLRNLRNMYADGVDAALIEAELMRGARRSRALPFRFVAAARTNPYWEPMIERAMFMATESLPRLSGHTTLLVDVSGSMDFALSAHSDLTRIDAACALAILCRQSCEDVSVWTFSHKLVQVPARRGFALRDAINTSQTHGATYLGQAIESLRTRESADRLVVITDEQAHDTVGSPLGKGYMLNVASAQNGVGYGAWTRITGFSEAVLAYIQATEEGAVHGSAD